MRNYWTALAIVLLLCGTKAEAAGPLDVGPASMSAGARRLFNEAMASMDQFWDPNEHLVATTMFGHPPAHKQYMVRETSWYALGLLARDQRGDRQRAAEAINAILSEQYHEPGTRWFGSFKRDPAEVPNPVGLRVAPTPHVATFDGNWREFVGVSFANMLAEYPDRIPSNLEKQMYAAIDEAVQGELSTGRLAPDYTNIALMYGFLLDFAAAHDKRADWEARSSAWNENIYQRFAQYKAFDEFNSPTYSGTDLIALALWRNYGSTERVRSIGSSMEAGLWEDVASFYQPNLKNICGPYDRAYGMDMTSYVAVMGDLMGTFLDPNRTPLPAKPELASAHFDFWPSVLAAVLEPRVPSDALSEMEKFGGPRLVRKQITAQRVATAWIGDRVMFGGESTGLTKEIGPENGFQFHPVTVHWQTPSGEIGWIMVDESPKINATADPKGVTITATGTVRFEVHAAGVTAEMLQKNVWNLPGLRITISSDARGFGITKGKDGLDPSYQNMTEMRLNIPAP